MLPCYWCTAAATAGVVLVLVLTGLQAIKCDGLYAVGASGDTEALFGSAILPFHHKSILTCGKKYGKRGRFLLTTLTL